MSAEEVLKARGSKYGAFIDNATVTQSLLEILIKVKLPKVYSQAHMETLHMICHKLARVACGDEDYDDNFVDIAGYATLMVNILQTKPKIPGESI